MLGFVCVDRQTHFMAFGTKVGYGMCNRPLPWHWWENDGLIEPKMTFLLCGEQYCVKFEGRLSGLEKYECVRFFMVYEFV